MLEKIHNLFMKRKIKAYLSHPIRGSAGENATKEIQRKNSDIASNCAQKLRNKFPWLWIYCPGEAERFVYETYVGGLLTDKQILDIDVKIELDCDVLLVYEFDRLGSGCRREIAAAKDNNIPVFYFDKPDRKMMKRLRKFLDSMN